MTDRTANTTSTGKVQTENGIHDFERAGLGKAPFRCVGMHTSLGPIRMAGPGGVTIEVGSPGQPMGCCAYCGQGIADCYTVKSADGKTFTVGCDCVRRTGDAGMKKVVNALVAKKNREKRHALENADIAYLAEQLGDKLDDTGPASERLAQLPHPKGFTDRTTGRPLTLLDWYKYMQRACGGSGSRALAKKLRADLAALETTAPDLCEDPAVADWRAELADEQEQGRDLSDIDSDRF